MDIRFRNAVKSDVNSLKELWGACFDEKDEAVNLFFAHCFSEENAYIATDGERIVSALYLIQGSINGHRAHYLCGASTHPDYRGHGIMGRLIEYSLEKAKKNGDKFSVLYPANESLYGFYRRFGYEEKCFAYTVHLSRKELEPLADKRVLSDESCNFEEIETVCFKNNFLYMNNKFISFASEYYRLYGAKTIKSRDCFAFFEEENGWADVFYFAYKENKFSELSALLLESSDAESFSFTCKGETDIFKNSVKEKYGMIKQLDSNISLTEEIFTGITLS